MPDPDSRTTPIGPIGRNVIKNVEELRADRGLSLRGLSERLGAIGRPILPAVLHRFGQGKRRVDVDDLVALALALRVNPNALLLPRHVAPDDVIELAPGTQEHAAPAWAWADGRITLPLTDRTRSLAESAADHARYSRPDFQIEPEPALREVFTLAAKLESVQAVPESWEMRRDDLVRSYRLLGIVLEELLDKGDREAKARGASGLDTAAAQAQVAAAAETVRERLRDPFGERDGQ
jgi:hypothetical protein